MLSRSTYQKKRFWNIYLYVSYRYAVAIHIREEQRKVFVMRTMVSIRDKGDERRKGVEWNSATSHSNFSSREWEREGNRFNWSPKPEILWKVLRGFSRCCGEQKGALDLRLGSSVEKRDGASEIRQDFLQVALVSLDVSKTTLPTTAKKAVK